MKKTSEDSFLKKLFFPKFKLLNSGCGLSAGVYGIYTVLTRTCIGGLWLITVCQSRGWLAMVGASECPRHPSSI